MSSSVKIPLRNHRKPRERLAHGVFHQRIVKLPPDVISDAMRRPLTRMLLPASIGFYPKAKGHLAERPNGSDEAILIYCIAGEGWCVIDGVRHVVTIGELLAIPPGVPHSYGASATKPWSIRWFHVVGETLHDYLAALGITRSLPVVSLGEDPMIDTLFEEILTELETGYVALNLIYVSQALGHLFGVMIRRRHSHRIGLSNPRQKVASSIEMMRSHLDRPLRMSRLAAMCNISPAHFIELFKEQIGYSPKDYLTRLKMHRACQLLAGTSLSIKEIALQVGYEDQLHFSRVFRKVNALSPTELRMRDKG